MTPCSQLMRQAVNLKQPALFDESVLHALTDATILEVCFPLSTSANTHRVGEPETADSILLRGIEGKSEYR